MRLGILLALVLVLAACTGATESGTTVGSSTTSVAAVPAATTEAVPPTTAAPSGDGTTTTRPAPNPDRQLAPDFSLTLSDGTVYQLANETRPVYMVFWAEW